MTIWTFVGKVMSLLIKTPSRFVIAFLPRGKHLLILWLQLSSSVILESKNIKFVIASTFLTSVCLLLIMTICHDLSFFNAEFQATFFTFLCHPHQEAFSFSLPFAIRVVSPAYLGLLLFVPAFLIPACDSSSLAFSMTYSAYKLNSQGDNI